MRKQVRSGWGRGLKLLIITITTFSVFLFFGQLGVYAGSKMSSYGKIAASKDVTHAFEMYVIDPNVNYYVSGPHEYPNAIIGVDRKYILQTTLWRKMEFDADSLRYFVNNMREKAREYGINVFGFDILDNKGKDIGNWYSILSARTAVRMGEDNKVTINTPDLDIFKEWGGDKGHSPQRR